MDSKTARYFRYSEEMIAFLRSGFMNMSITQLTAAFNAHFALNKSVATLHSTLQARGIKCGRSPGDLSKGRPRRFTLEQKHWCIKHYPLMTRKKLTVEFNQAFNEDRRLSQILAFLKNNRISSGRTGFFKKGQVSWSAGTKGILKSNSGSFKKGLVPHNHKVVGSERIVKGGYIEVKTAEPCVWTPKSHLIWQRENGPVPKRHNLRYKDGNPGNLAPDNLFLVNNAEHQILNNTGFKHYALAHKDTVILIARITNKTNEVSQHV